MNRFDSEVWVCDTQYGITCFGGGTSTSSSSSTPWSGQEPYLSNVMQSAQQQYQNYTPQTYLEATGINPQATMNDQQTGAINDIYNTGTNGSPTLSDANSAVQNTLNANPANNPYYQQMNNQIMSQVQPQLESQFAQGNNMNSPAAAYATSQGLGDALGSTEYSNYNQGVQNQNNAAAVGSNLYNTQLGGENQALGAGNALQNQAQQSLNNIVSSFNFQQQVPYTTLNQYSNLVNGQYGGTSTTTSPNQGLLSMFSDRRLKERITKLGEMHNGIGVYEFSYKGSKVRDIGLMAQEVEKLKPDAVKIGPFGYKVVNYSLALGGAL